MSSQDLLFEFPPPSGNDLVFGDDTIGPVPTREVYFAAVLPGLTLSAKVLKVDEATFAGTLPALSMATTLAYDNAVTRYLQGAARAPHQSAEMARPTLVSQWDTGVSRRGGKAAPHQVGKRTGHDSEGAHALGDPRVKSSSMPHQIGAQVRSERGVRAQMGDPRQIKRDASYQPGIPSSVARVSRHQTGENRRYVIAGDWQTANPSGIEHLGTSGHSAYRLGKQATVARWQTTRNPLQGRSVAPTVPVDNPCYTPSPDLLFTDLALTTSLDLVFICKDITNPPTESVVVPVRKVYMVTNNVILRRVSDNAPIHALSMSLSLDVNSWAWSFSASLPGEVQAMVEPDNNGPIQLKATVNGTDFIVLAEKLSRERTFGRTGIRVSGRGRHAYLDAPYAGQQTFGNTAIRTAQQIMDEVLTVNGASLGWTINWELDDWVVPANVFNHQGTYITAISAIAKAAGGYLMPHASLDQFTVKHLYPTAPWDWGSVTPDFVLPSDVTTRESLEWLEKPAYTRVYVSGQGQGILGRVTRAGTSGDVLAPMVTDQLITATVAARQRGLSVLADTGRQRKMGLRLPVLPETGIIMPGDFVQYEDSGETLIGMVRGTGIEVGLPNVWQNLEVETHL